MVIAKRILGRLGNQMFQYAYCRAIKEKTGGSLAFNFDKVYQQKELNKNEVGFEDSLQYFNVDNYDTFTGNEIDYYGNFVQVLIYRIFQVIGHILFPNQTCYNLYRHLGLFFYCDAHQDFYKDIALIKKKSIFHKLVICYDYLESPSFFNDIRPILLHDFTPKQPPLEYNKKLYDIIESHNSVCVSIRRGDYLNPKYADRFFICDETYIANAIEKIKQLIKDPVLIFFSDDIKWVEENIKTELPSYYESGNDPIWEKLRLMYSCKHFIISNSTFSWWAQYLSRNDKKIVVSPDHWFKDSSPDNHHLISYNFITIPCNILSK